MTNWNTEMLRLRTQGDKRRFGFSPSAPDKAELEVFLTLLGQNNAQDEALVMGMTAGLRDALLVAGCSTFCVDSSADAIEYLRNSIGNEAAVNETVFHADWCDMDKLRQKRFPAVVGDGVFGVLKTETIPKVLLAIGNSLRPGGVLITRMLLIPSNFDFADNTQSMLIQKYRDNQIGPEDFAMGMRLWANFDAYYEKDTQYFRNAKSFAKLEQLRNQEVITASEHLHITRRFFGGNNFLPHEADWEKTLEDANFSFEKTVIEGKDWYQYMPIYACYPNAKKAEPK